MGVSSFGYVNKEASWSNLHVFVPEAVAGVLAALLLNKDSPHLRREWPFPRNSLFRAGSALCVQHCLPQTAADLV